MRIVGPLFLPPPLATRPTRSLPSRASRATSSLAGYVSVRALSLPLVDEQRADPLLVPFAAGARASSRARCCSPAVHSREQGKLSCVRILALLKPAAERGKGESAHAPRRRLLLSPRSPSSLLASPSSVHRPLRARSSRQGSQRATSSPHRPASPHHAQPSPFSGSSPSLAHLDTSPRPQGSPVHSSCSN